MNLIKAETLLRVSNHDLLITVQVDYFIAARAETVLKQLLEAMKSFKESSTTGKEEVSDSSSANENSSKENEASVAPNKEDVTTPIIEITANLSVQDPNVMDNTKLGPRRRLSSSAKLTRQSNSISGVLWST